MTGFQSASSLMRPLQRQANNETYTSTSMPGEAANALNQYETIVRDGKTYQLSYTKNGSIRQKTEVGGPTTTYTYDVENRLVRVDLEGGDYVRFSYAKSLVRPAHMPAGIRAWASAEGSWSPVGKITAAKR